MEPTLNFIQGQRKNEFRRLSRNQHWEREELWHYYLNLFVHSTFHLAISTHHSKHWLYVNYFTKFLPSHLIWNMWPFREPTAPSDKFYPDTVILNYTYFFVADIENLRESMFYLLHAQVLEHCVSLRLYFISVCLMNKETY